MKGEVHDWLSSCVYSILYNLSLENFNKMSFNLKQYVRHSTETAPK